MLTGIEKLVSVAFSTFVAKPVGEEKVNFLCEGMSSLLLRDMLTVASELLWTKRPFFLLWHVLSQDLSSTPISVK